MGTQVNIQGCDSPTFKRHQKSLSSHTSQPSPCTAASISEYIGLHDDIAYKSFIIYIIIIISSSSSINALCVNIQRPHKPQPLAKIELWVSHNGVTCLSYTHTDTVWSR